MGVPTDPLTLMFLCYKKVFPTVNICLNYWKERAENIPNEELRKQALASIRTKTFHCEGGAIFSLLTGEENDKDVIAFVVAYQTISDYLDNLCDRSTSLDPLDFRTLHQSMLDALTVDCETQNYYRFREEQNDGHYLIDLVKTCQSILSKMKNYPLIKDYLIQLCEYYCDLQVHKHVKKAERLPRLKNWFQAKEGDFSDMTWFEFSACAGSTLGIFCLVASGFRNDFTYEQSTAICKGYFPYIQGLHILLDYFIDQEEDKEGGDLNFCAYYESNDVLLERFQYFIQEADRHTQSLPNRKFHQMINRGLLGLYLSDCKIKTQKDTEILARKIIKKGGFISLFFYLNAKLYRKKTKR